MKKKEEKNNPVKITLQEVIGRVDSRIMELQRVAQSHAVNYASSGDPIYQSEFRKLEFAIGILIDLTKSEEPKVDGDNHLKLVK